MPSAVEQAAATMNSLPEVAARAAFCYRLPLDERDSTSAWRRVLLADSAARAARARSRSRWRATHRWRFGRFCSRPSRPLTAAPLAALAAWLAPRLAALLANSPAGTSGLPRAGAVPAADRAGVRPICRAARR